MRSTAFRGIRVPDWNDLTQPQAMERMAGDFDTATTKTDALRSSAFRRPRARAIRNTGNQSVAKNTWTALVGFDTVSYDNNTMANLGANNDRLTCKTAGVFYCRAASDFPASGADPDEARMAIARNGATAGSVDFIQKPLWTHNSSSYEPECTAMFSLAVNDFLSLWVFWNGTPAGPFLFDTYWLSMTMIATP